MAQMADPDVWNFINIGEIGEKIQGYAGLALFNAAVAGLLVLVEEKDSWALKDIHECKNKTVACDVVQLEIIQGGLDGVETERSQLHES